MTRVPITGRVPTNGIFATIEKLTSRLMGPTRFLAGFSGVWDRVTGLPAWVAAGSIRESLVQVRVGRVRPSFRTAEPSIMPTSSRLPWDAAPKVKTPEPHGLTLPVAAQLFACGLVGWTVFAVSVERLLPHFPAASATAQTTAGANAVGANPPAITARGVDAAEHSSARSIHSLVGLPTDSRPAESATLSNELQVAAAGLTVPNSHH